MICPTTLSPTRLRQAVQRVFSLQCLLAALFLMPCGAAAQQHADAWLANPVDRGTFEGFLTFFAYDARVPLALERTHVRTFDGAREDRIVFQSTPGVRVTARWVAASGQPNRPAAILLHGGVAQGKDAFPEAALSALIRGGIDVLVIDMMYFGERKTELLTTFTERDKHDHLYNQPATYLGWVTQTVKDVGRAFDVLVQLGVDPARIGLLGYSRGGQVGLIAAAADPRLRAVAIIFAGHFDRSETGHLAPACPANYIGRISPRPLFLLNGRRDSDYVEETSVAPLHRHARDPVETVWVDTGHQMPSPAELTMIATWLRDRLSAGNR